LNIYEKTISIPLTPS